ncbi:hypothetical protein Taro_048964 [Colocasia esculenta]|uniref:Uncharacterized protein n=1 Tax=Colocasia esculenta TaxID=4460 RepID=A0A843X9K7_COLES|nr:hypothetical protein [Colocasia esculenta]
MQFGEKHTVWQLVEITIVIEELEALDELYFLLNEGCPDFRLIILGDVAIGKDNIEVLVVQWRKMVVKEGPKWQEEKDQGRLELQLLQHDPALQLLPHQQPVAWMALLVLLKLALMAQHLVAWPLKVQNCGLVLQEKEQEGICGLCPHQICKCSNRLLNANKLTSHPSNCISDHAYILS